VCSKSTAAGPGDYPKRRGALTAFYSAWRHEMDVRLQTSDVGKVEYPTGVLPPDDWWPTTDDRI